MQKALPLTAYSKEPNKRARKIRKPEQSSTRAELNPGGVQPGRSSTRAELNPGGAQPERCSTLLIKATNPTYTFMWYVYESLSCIP